MKKNSKPKHETVEDRLAAIHKLNGGRITPDAVVEDARDPRSPLHSHFEWDDSAAARQYRLDQARALIRTVKLEISIVSNTIAAPHYVRDPRAGDGQGYVALSQVRSEDDLARQVMRDEMSRVLAAMERARSVSDVLDMTGELDNLIIAIEEVRNRALKSRAA